MCHSLVKFGVLTWERWRHMRMRLPITGLPRQPLRRYIASGLRADVCTSRSGLFGFKCQTPLLTVLRLDSCGTLRIGKNVCGTVKSESVRRQNSILTTKSGLLTPFKVTYARVQLRRSHVFEKRKCKPRSRKFALCILAQVSKNLRNGCPCMRIALKDWD